MLVLGSSTDGAVGRIVVGSTDRKLLHSSPIPLALSPRGYRSPPPRFSRVTCAFSDGEDRRAGGPGRGLRPELGARPGGQLRRPWRHHVPPGRAVRRGLGDRLLGGAGVARPEPAAASTGSSATTSETVIATGAGWGESMSSVDWAQRPAGAGVVLDASARPGLPRLPRDKMVRHSPVPVLVVPRGYERRRGADRPTLIRTDRQVTHPSSFSNSVIGMVTTSSPRPRTARRCAGHRRT